MKAIPSTLYTNEASQKLLKILDRSPFTEQQMAEFSKEALTCIRQQQAYCEAHPADAIYRLATEGSQTRSGGVIQRATSLLKIKLSNGNQVHVAQVGDCVVYADGSTAHIVTGAGQGNNDVALVDSVLSNGDQIINTPQDMVLLLRRKGIPKAEDFLPAVKG